MVIKYDEIILKRFFFPFFFFSIADAHTYMKFIHAHHHHNSFQELAERDFPLAKYLLIILYISLLHTWP